MNTDERFDKFVVPEGDCLRWTSYCDAGGYGHFWEGTLESGGRKAQYAHRYAYERHKGKIPKGLHIRHKCHNRWCVNPEHLSVGTPMDNISDTVAAGRQTKGVTHGMVKLTESQVLLIRLRYSLGEPQATLSREFNVSRQTIWKIVHRANWTHL